MAKWQVDVWVPYEGISREHFDTDEAAVEYLSNLSSYDQQACGYTVYLAPDKEYEPAEFLAMMKDK